MCIYTTSSLSIRLSIVWFFVLAVVTSGDVNRGVHVSFGIIVFTFLDACPGSQYFQRSDCMYMNCGLKEGSVTAHGLPELPEHMGRRKPA